MFAWFFWFTGLFIDACAYEIGGLFSQILHVCFDKNSPSIASQINMGFWIVQGPE